MLDDRGDKMLGEYHNGCSKRFLWFFSLEFFGAEEFHRLLVELKSCNFL